MTEPLTIRTVICGLDQLDLHSASRVTHVLSILDPGFPEPDAFKAYGPHARTSLRFHDEIEPGPDRILPQANDIETILSLGRTMSAGPLPDGYFAFDRRHGHPAFDDSPGHNRGRHLCQAARAATQRLAELPYDRACGRAASPPRAVHGGGRSSLRGAARQKTGVGRLPAPAWPWTRGRHGGPVRLTRILIPSHRCTAATSRKRA